MAVCLAPSPPPRRGRTMSPGMFAPAPVGGKIFVADGATRPLGSSLYDDDDDDDDDDVSRVPSASVGPRVRRRGDVEGSAGA